jgi:tubulin polyglutamylase TTLL9
MELQDLKIFLMSRYGIERIDALFWEIQMIMLKALLAVQPIMINDKHCFELYGESYLSFTLDHLISPRNCSCRHVKKTQ